MSKTLLPLNEPLEFQNRDIKYREIIKDYGDFVDLNPMTCEASLLPHLAQAVQVLYWSELLTTKEKRLLISNTRLLHKHLGTPFAIKKVFELLNIEAELVEWFNHEDLDPYEFKVILFDKNHKGYSAKHIKTFEAMIEVYKNVRSVLNEIEMHQKLSFKTFYSQFLLTGEAITLTPKQLDSMLESNLNFKNFLVIEVFEQIKL